MKQILFFLVMASRDQLINLMFIILGIAALYGLYRLFKLLGVTWFSVVAVIVSIIMTFFTVALFNILGYHIFGRSTHMLVSPVIGIGAFVLMFRYLKVYLYKKFKK